MRVLFVVHQFMPEFASGTEQVTLAMAKAAQRSGHRATVLTCSLDPDAPWGDTTPEGFRRAAIEGLEVAGIPLAMLPEGPQGFADVDELGQRIATPALARLNEAVDKFISRGSFDLVHVTHAMRMMDVVARVRAAELPYVLTLTDFFLMCYRINLVRRSGALCAGPEEGRACATHCKREDLNVLMLEQRQAAVASLLRGAAFRVACSPFVADAFRGEYPDLQISVIGHGIDLLRMLPRAPRTDDRVVFGYLGTISQAKGADVIMRAVAAAPEARLRLDMVGPLSGDALFAEEMQAIAAADPRIRLHGAVPASRVPAALSGFDVLCLPTRMPETFSLAMHEGFAAGLPALVADLGHPARVVTEAGCGLVLPDGDQAAWSDAMNAVAEDPWVLDRWRSKLPLPARVEEETFLYGQLYKACIA